MGSTLTNKLFLKYPLFSFVQDVTWLYQPLTNFQKKALSRNMPKEAHALYVMFQVVDRLWPVKLHNYSCSCSSHDFSLVLFAFVRENALQVGDVWKTRVNKIKWYTFFYIYVC